LLQKEKAGIVRRILNEMTNERDIQALFRFYLAEDDKEQICADLGLTNLQFNLVLHRARERYRELYERTMRDKLYTGLSKRCGAR
jgi:RNA polymerase sigma-70 factor, ECF subfamily